MRFGTATLPRTFASMMPCVAAVVFVAAGACSSDEESNNNSEPSDAGFLADVGFVDSGVTSTEMFDLMGTWASFRVSSQCFDGPLGLDRVVFTWIAKHRFTQNGNSAEMTTEVCALTATDYRGSETAYPSEAIDAFDARAITVALGGDTVGSSFIGTPQAILLGWMPTGDPVTEMIPQDDMDDRLVDADNDTNPGVTLTVTGFVSGDVYLANRNVVTLTGLVAAPDRIEGTGRSISSQRIVGASAILLNNNTTAVTDDPDPASSPFEIVRLGSDLSCANIVADAANLFTLTSTMTTTGCPQ